MQASLMAAAATAGDASIEHAVYQVAWLLLGAAVVGIVSWRIRVPYAVALVLGGIVVAHFGFVNAPTLTPNVVLFVFLPPLLFDAAFRLDVREFRLELRPILALAAPGTLATAAIVGAALALTGTAALGPALLFGAVVAATDPVAVIGVFRRLNVSPRLATIAEAESLINDGMAITLFTALSGYAVTGDIESLHVATIFARQVFVGVLVGVVAGLIVAWLTRSVEDHLVEMALSTALAYGSYLIAHSLGASGPLACVAAGLLHGSYGRAIGMTPGDRQILDDLWEYLGFAANGFVFLLVGFSVDLSNLFDHAGRVVIAIVAVVVGRFIVLEGFARLAPRDQASVTAPERVVLGWGGLRGALTIALALALPFDVPERDLLITLAFGVVLFTLLIQALTLPWVIERLGLARTGFVPLPPTAGSPDAERDPAAHGSQRSERRP